LLIVLLVGAHQVACSGTIITDVPSSDGGAHPAADPDRGADDTAKEPGPTPKGGTVRIQIRNTTASPVYVLRDMQTTPLWLHIASRPLNIYGSQVCGYPGLHNDPVTIFSAIAPGGTLAFDWDGKWAESRGGCWDTAYAEPGTYPSRVCVYPQTPEGPLGRSYDGGANDEICKDVSVVLPASGKGSVEVVF
jgi:hypothetical protein